MSCLERPCASSRASARPEPSPAPDVRPNVHQLPPWFVARLFPTNAARTTPVRPSRPPPRNCRSIDPPNSPRVRHRALSVWASGPLLDPRETARCRNDGSSSRHAVLSLHPTGSAATWSDSLETLPPVDRSDNPHCIRDSRFFLTQTFLQSLGARLEQDVADLEFGLAENLPIRLTDQKPSDLQKLLLG